MISLKEYRPIKTIQIFAAVQASICDCVPHRFCVLQGSYRCMGLVPLAIWAFKEQHLGEHVGESLSQMHRSCCLYLWAGFSDQIISKKDEQHFLEKANILCAFQEDRTSQNHPDELCQFKEIDRDFDVYLHEQDDPAMRISMEIWFWCKTSTMLKWWQTSFTRHRGIHK